jgi:hypothetical protein
MSGVSKRLGVRLRLVAMLCASLAGIVGCAPQVAPVSSANLGWLRKNTTARQRGEFSKGDVPSHFPLRLPPGAVVKLPLDTSHQIPVVPGELEGKALPWIVDSGAAYPVLVDAQSAVEAGLRPIENVGVRGVGVGGQTQLLLGRFRELSLGGRSVLGPGVAGILMQNYRITFAGIPWKRMPLNLFGLPLLEQFSHVTFDGPAREVTFSRAGRYKPRVGAFSVPFTRAADRLWVDLSIGGHRVRAFLDTGCGSALRLSPASMQGIPQECFAVPHGKTRRAMGVGGVETEEVGVLKHLDLGDLRLRRVEYDTHPNSEENILGWGAFFRVRATLDFVRNRMWVELAE